MMFRNMVTSLLDKDVITSYSIHYTKLYDFRKEYLAVNLDKLSGFEAESKIDLV